MNTHLDGTVGTGETEDADALRDENTRLHKINRALMNRVERGINVQGADGFALLESAIALEHTVRERTAALQEAMRRLEATNRELVRARDAADAANRAKSAFLARMSHEIRTPMSAVVGTAELLEHTGLSAHQHRLMERILGSSAALLSIIDDILDFSRLEAGRLNIEAIEFDLRKAIEEPVELQADAAQRKGIELVLDLPAHMPPAVIGDPTRLRQVLTNLVNNAVKFTSEGEIVVSLEQRPVDESGRCVLEIEVRDTGIGLDEADRDHLFESFTQAEDSTTRHYGGSGLGLAISRQLVELMGGTIDVKSRPGEGATFHMELAFPLGEGEPPTTPSILDGLRVLVVDDHRIAGETLARGLGSLGLRCTHVTSGVVALGMLLEQGEQDERFEAVVADHHMPGMTGGALIAAMHADPSMTDIATVLLCPVASFTTPMTEGMPAEVPQLTKPVRLHRLAHSLAEAVGDLEATAGTGRRAPLPPPAPDAPPRILLVEDNEIARSTGEDILGFYGFDVDFAMDGREAVDRLAADPSAFDVVLMDCHMPRLDGLSATRLIREQESADPTRPRARIVAVTGDAMRGERERCLSAGMDDYITKPFRMTEIRDVVLRWTEDRRGVPVDGDSAQG